MTCWFCPKCGYVYREWFGKHIIAESLTTCNVAAVKAKLVPLTDAELERDLLDTYDGGDT